MSEMLESKGKSTKSKEKHIKRSLTPFERLKKRILKEFQTKTFIGDIIIKESEYELLIEYFKAKCKVLLNSYINTVNDPVFATALVQIGIKYYDGRFWPHIENILGISTSNINYRYSIGGTFIETILAYKKPMLDKSEYVNNILMHGFVSDYYANEMFDFLFKYYNLDLERDLKRNNKEMMDNLIEIIQRNDNTGRTYLLVKQTANAISTNTRGGKIRIRRLLRLIDRCFWEGITPVNPISRLSILFNEWQQASDEFKIQYDKYHNGSSGGGKKSFISPYLKCDFVNTSFQLILPTQLIKFEYHEDIKWKIRWADNLYILIPPLYQAVTGYKTEVEKLNIKREDIFNEFSIELYSGENRIRFFKIKTDSIRFFDKDGDLINLDNSSQKGDVYSFTKAYEIPKSDALIEYEYISNLVRSYFKFEYGDIVILPEGKPISIGKKIEEGLLYRNVISGAYALYDESTIPIYKLLPSVMIKIKANRANGTMIEVNGRRYHLFDKAVTEIDLQDRSGETGYIVNLCDFGCTSDGIYTVYVDVPNDRTNRLWRFALINNISYEFEDAPYIFKPKGTIRFNDGLILYPQGNIEEKNNDENSFNFRIIPDLDYLHFKYHTDREEIDLYFEIPAFKWRFNSQQWNIEKPNDIWHSNFPSMIYIKYPSDKIIMSLDEELDTDNYQDQHTVTYIKSKSKGIFECNTTRFKSWFGREKVKRSVFIDFPKNRTEFIKVITRSVVSSHIIKGDFSSGKMIGEFDIIGYASYYTDIVMAATNKIIKEKIPIVNGRFEFNDKLDSGLYKITVYEDEEDDTGFGLYNYLKIDEFIHDIINPYNLNGKNIAVKHLEKSKNGVFHNQLSCKYVICDLQKISEENDYEYKGKLMINTPGGKSPISYDVKVEFSDLNKLHSINMTYFDGYDYIEFLYDNYRRIIVKEEEKGLSRAVKYRRYECLFADEYTYIGEFTNVIPDSYSPADNQINKQFDNHIIWKEKETNMSIEEMDFTIRTYNSLHSAKIKTAKDIENIGTQNLFKIRNLGKLNIIEIITKMRSLGYYMDDIKSNEAEEQLALTDEDINDNLNNGYYKKVKIDIQEANDVMKTSLSQIGISSLVLNKLKKSKIYTVGDVAELGIKKLKNVQGLNKKMCKELLDKLYSVGVIVK